ncbi:MAG: BON domain-containing protein [Planctomycetota bacterium]|nr:MAG: BON domain-containing protein [Planctomycetota bacterium]
MSVNRPDRIRANRFLCLILVAAWGSVGAIALAQEQPGAGADVSQQETEPATAEEPGDRGSPAETADDPEGSASVPDAVSVQSVSDDESIGRRLTGILEATGWFSEPNVSVRNGVVFLSGTTTVDEHREWAAGLARNTEDVVAVVNRINVDHAINYRQSTNMVAASLEGMWESFLLRIPNIVAGLLLLVVTWIVARIVVYVLSRVAKRSRLRTSLQDLISQFATITVWICGLLAAAVVVFPGMTPSKVLTVLGLGSVAVGFAFKDIFENFFAGVLILWKFPFDRGDFIECEGLRGKVEEITIRMTNIRQVDGQLVVVPNAMLFKNPVDVMTSRKVRRITVICGVAYSEDVDQSRDVIRRAVEQCRTVDGQHNVEIFAREFADSSINFEVTWWCGSTPRQERESRDEVVAAVKRALDDAGIEIPFPYRTLTFAEPLQTAGVKEQEPSAATDNGR